MKRSLLIGLAALSTLFAQEFTRGVGVYPGDPKEFFGPSLAADAATYRNLAFHRPAYQSSAYDYNLTAQLVTDGIKETNLPRWISVSTSDRRHCPRQPARVRWWITTRSLGRQSTGPRWIQFDRRRRRAPEIDRIERPGRVAGGCGARAAARAAKWTLVVPAPTMGKRGRNSGRTPAATAGEDAQSHRSLRCGSAQPVAQPVSTASRFEVAGRARPGASARLRSTTRTAGCSSAGRTISPAPGISAGTGEEWVYVDLGAVCTFDRVALDWIRRRRGLHSSLRRRRNWKTLQALPPRRATDDLKLAQPAKGALRARPHDRTTRPTATS